MTNKTEDQAETLEQEFVLKKPVGTCKSIILREPLASHIEMAEQLAMRDAQREGVKDFSANTMVIHLITLVGGVPLPTVKNLGARDFNAMRSYLQRFFLDSPETGAN